MTPQTVYHFFIQEAAATYETISKYYEVNRRYPHRLLVPDTNWKRYMSHWCGLEIEIQPGLEKCRLE